MKKAASRIAFRYAVIYPKSKKIACVLLQAAYGGNRYIPQLFDIELWEVEISDEKPIMASGTLDQWRQLAKKWEYHGG